MALDWFASLFNTKTQIDPQFIGLGGKAVEAHYRDVAFLSVCKLMAGAGARCRYRYYEQKKDGETESRTPLLHSLNVSPNKNQNANVFWQEVITRLLLNNEALVIKDPSLGYVIAESFEKEQNGNKPVTFTNVTVGDYTYSKTFKASDVWHFRYSHTDGGAVVNKLYESYGALISAASETYRTTRGRRFIVTLPGSSSLAYGGKNEPDALAAVYTGKFKQLFEAQSGVAVFGGGVEWRDVSEELAKTVDISDYSGLIDGIFKITAAAYNVPLPLLLGNVADVSECMVFFRSFALASLLDCLEREVTAKTLGADDYFAGRRLVLDRSSLSPLDLLTVATNGDKLIANGFYSVNEIRHKLGEPKLAETWADKHFITLNYQEMEGQNEDDSNSRSRSDKG